MDEYKFKQKAPVIQQILDDVSNKSAKHHGEFNAGNITEEGWYDSITSGRPEGSESDERYVLYQSSNGGQLCFSRRNSGKVYVRLGKEHPWVNVSYCDHSLEHATAMALITYGQATVVDADDVKNSSTHTDGGFGYDGNTNLLEYYAGDGGEVKHFHVALPITLSPDDILKVRCTYRRGGSYEGVNQYKYDSDAYLYVSRSAEEGHNLDQLVSDFFKVKPLGGQHFPFTEEQASWQDLAFIRDTFFADGTTYGRHLLKVNAEAPGTYYLHIVGDFSTPASWFALDKVEKFSAQGTSNVSDGSAVGNDENTNTNVEQ
jgi:hypothetical protein